MIYRILFFIAGLIAVIVAAPFETPAEIITAIIGCIVMLLCFFGPVLEGISDALD